MENFWKQNIIPIIVADVEFKLYGYSFDYLVETGEMSSNPVRKIPTSPKFVDIPRPTKFIDVKTLWMSLLQSKNGDGLLSELITERNRVIFLLIYNAGLKVSDLAKLRVDQLSLGGQPRVLITPKRDPIFNSFKQLNHENYQTIFERA